MVKKQKEYEGKVKGQLTTRWPWKLPTLDDAQREEILATVEGRIETNAELGMSCSETTFTSLYQGFKKWTDLPKEVIRLSSGFAGGGGGTSHSLCGAVSGGLMGLGLFWGRIDTLAYFQTLGLNSIEEAMEKPEISHEYYRVFNVYIKEFESHFGSITCRNLLKDHLDSNGFFVTDPIITEERKARCRNFMMWGALRVSKLILEGQEKGTQHMEMGHNIYNIK